MKYCYKCGETKEPSEFHRNKNKSDGLQNYCKSCAQIRNKDYYIATPERNAQRQAHRLRALQQAQEYAWNYLLDNPCIDCGESDPVVLEFDHVRGLKLYAVSDMVRKARSLASIASEIAKCEVRCANCHRRVTSARGGWYTGPVSIPL